jgi:hypothetical protein
MSNRMIEYESALAAFNVAKELYRDGKGTQEEYLQARDRMIKAYRELPKAVEVEG